MISEDRTLYSPMTPLLAYRADRAQASGRRFTDSDDDLVSLGVVLYRCQQVRGHEEGIEEAYRLRPECLPLLENILSVGERVVPWESGNAHVSSTAVVNAVREAADIGEEGGALRLADALLFLAYREFGYEAGYLEQGRLIAQRARIARKRGLPAIAEELYKHVHEWGVQRSLPELDARADIGMAMLARERGNIPEMSMLFARAFESAQLGDSKEVLAVAHHGMMLSAVAVKAFDRAIVHAWTAFRVVRGNRLQEGDALLNLGQVILDSGEPSVALHAFVAALALGLPRRLEFPALGGAAVAAAAVGDRATLERVINRADRLSLQTDLKYDALAALTEIVSALSMIGDARSEARRELVLEEAEAANFHELVFRLTEAGVGAPRSTAPTPPAVAGVFRDVEAMREWDELLAAL
jgi:hypothetical protein